MEELLQKIIIKAYEVSKNTKHDVFVDFAGHVNSLRVYVCLDGYEEHKSFDTTMETYLHLNKEVVLENLQNILKNLEELEEE